MARPEIDILERLEATTRADLLRLSTAGSVDDGKSTLIGRLLHDSHAVMDDQLAMVSDASKRHNREIVDLALLLDGLKAEREQGITIDVAHRYFATPKRRFIIADTPGHEQYTRNMVTGASTANVSIILVDAKNGITTQSKRHGFLAALLRVPHVAVVINKMDLVDWSRERFDELRAEYTDFSRKLQIGDVQFIPVSALHGDNVVVGSSRMPWYQGPTLIHYLESIYIAGDRNLIDLRLPVQYVNRPTSDVRAYCGTVRSGVIRPGTEILALPSKRVSRVERLLSFDGDLDYAFPPQAISVTLADELDISRGDMLVHPGNQPQIDRELEAMLVWMDESPLRVGAPYLARTSAQEVRGVVTTLRHRVDPNDLHRHDATALTLNQIGRVHVDLYAPLILDEYSRNRSTGSFTLIDPLSNRTVAAGFVTHVGSAPRVESNEVAPTSKNITRHESQLQRSARRGQLTGSKAITLWFTGLSGSGKSTTAFALEQALVEAGVGAYVLDGDNLRHGLNRDLGFSPDDRSENLRRVAEVAKLMNDAGVVVITSFIAPYNAERERAREIIGEGFREVFIDAPLEICESRDPKGLYARARAGEIPDFTGVNAPYEAPQAPDIHLRSDRSSTQELVEVLLAELRRLGIVERAGDQG